MTTAKEKYQALTALGEKAEKQTGKYLWDACIDRENVADAFPNDDTSEAFWSAMCAAGSSAFGMRCEEVGLVASDFGISY